MNLPSSLACKLQYTNRGYKPFSLQTMYWIISPGLFHEYYWIMFEIIKKKLMSEKILLMSKVNKVL